MRETKVAELHFASSPAVFIIRPYTAAAENECLYYTRVVPRLPFGTKKGGEKNEGACRLRKKAFLLYGVEPRHMKKCLSVPLIKKLRPIKDISCGCELEKFKKRTPSHPPVYSLRGTVFPTSHSPAVNQSGR
jgi:hypothetical protein